MASALIEFRNVSLSFHRETILDGVSFSIKESEKVALIGPSGHGKSLILKLMSGILRPTSGQILIHGADLWQLSIEQRTQTRRKMGMLFQKNALFDSLTCLENVIFPLHEVTQTPEDAAHQKAISLLDSVGLAHATDLYPDEISGGMQKRLGIARALALEPEIIFYDDPTAGLDPITSRKIIDLILSLQKQKKSTLVAITNDMNRAYQLADRIFMVVDKTVIIAGTPTETKESANTKVHQFVRGLK